MGIARCISVADSHTWPAQGTFVWKPTGDGLRSGTKRSRFDWTQDSLGRILVLLGFRFAPSPLRSSRAVALRLAPLPRLAPHPRLGSPRVGSRLGAVRVQQSVGGKNSKIVSDVWRSVFRLAFKLYFFFHVWPAAFRLPVAARAHDSQMLNPSPLTHAFHGVPMAFRVRL